MTSNAGGLRIERGRAGKDQLDVGGGRKLHRYGTPGRVESKTCNVDPRP